MADRSAWPFRLIVAAGVVLALAGLGLIAAGGGRGSMALSGFAIFCFAMAALDGLYRRRFGFRQIAILLGWFAVGIAVWTMVAAALMRMLELRFAPELRSLFIVAAACAAGSAAGALLTITLRGHAGDVLRTRLVGFARRVGSVVSRRDEARRDQPSGAEPPRRPAEPAQGG